MRPSRALRYYYTVTFILGLMLTVPLAQWVRVREVGPGGAVMLTFSLNVFFVMILPLVLDWAERRYFKARFLAVEELAKDNPELALLLSSQCEKLHLPGLKLAVVDDSNNNVESGEVFSYGLWRNNPRLILSNQMLKEGALEKSLAPSLEAELTRFANQDHTLIFILYSVFQLMLVVLLVHLMGQSAVNLPIL